MKKKNRIALLCIGAVWGALTIGCLALPAKESSESERRKLVQFPELSWNTVRSGSFMTRFETYTLDQFPLRDTFRKVKAESSRYVFGKKESNGYYMAGDYVAKLDYPLHDDSVSHALEVMKNIYETYLNKEKQSIYVSVVPDKGYFMVKGHGYPSMDYEALFQMVKKETPYAVYLSIADKLSLDSYYKTDTHWRQEKLLEVADFIRKSMGNAEPIKQFQVKQTSDSFYGVYAGQSGYSVKPESLNYCTNEWLEACTISNLENKSDTNIYNLEKVNGRDPYDIFLSGATPLITIDNPNGKEDKELVVFRDSFGSSLIPLIVQDYKKVTLIDVRYMKASQIGNYVKFDKQDILFLYSSLLLQSSYSMG